MKGKSHINTICDLHHTITLYNRLKNKQQNLTAGMRCHPAVFFAPLMACMSAGFFTVKSQDNSDTEQHSVTELQHDRHRQGDIINQK